MMELFNIVRYAEDGEIEKEPKPEHEDKLLKKLLKKAKKRKHEEVVEKRVVEEEITEEKLPEIETDEAKESADVAVTNGETNLEQSQTAFQVLGDDVFKKKQKVDMILPSWLAHPTVITTKITDDSNDALLENIKYLAPEIMRNLKKMGITKLFPVQKEVVPSILHAHAKPFPFKPRDVCVSAPTGSGKTLAFGIPLVQLLMNRVECKIRALVILPVNELALQVFKVLKSLAADTILSVRLLSKGIPFHREQQQLVDFHKDKYYSKADIVVTTPGRLVEHLHSTKGFCLNDLQYLVIDEADRIMEQIHFNWLYHLDEHVRKTSDEFFSGSTPPLCLRELMGSIARQPQKLLFSATLSHDPEKLVNLKLFQPKLFTTVVMPIEELIEKLTQNKTETTNGNHEAKSEVRGEFIGKYTTPAELTEKFCLTEIQTKPLTLFALAKENNWKRFLCFTNSVDSAYRLALVLKTLCRPIEGFLIAEISAQLTAKRRAEILDSFTKGRVKGLICSDALARGIDIPEVDIVVSYDVPRHIKTYIHRIGRTARAGRPGTAITLLSDEELKKFRKTLKEAGKTITEEAKVNGLIEEEYAASYTNALKQLQIKLQKDKQRDVVRKSAFTKRAHSFKPQQTTATATSMEKLQSQLNTKMKFKYNDEKIPRKFRKKIKDKKKKPAAENN